MTCKECAKKDAEIAELDESCGIAIKGQHDAETRTFQMMQENASLRKRVEESEAVRVSMGECVAHNAHRGVAFQCPKCAKKDEEISMLRAGMKAQADVLAAKSRELEEARKLPPSVFIAWAGMLFMMIVIVLEVCTLASRITLQT